MKKAIFHQRLVSKHCFIWTNRWCQPPPWGWFYSSALCLFICLLFCLLPKAVGICLCTFMNNAARLLGLMIFNLLDFHTYAYIFIYLCYHSITRGDEVPWGRRQCVTREVLCHLTWQLDFCYPQIVWNFRFKFSHALKSELFSKVNTLSKVIAAI